jgi:hypothetical protein
MGSMDWSDLAVGRDRWMGSMDWSDLAVGRDRWMGSMDWSDLAVCRDRWMALENEVMSLQVPYCSGNFFTS